MRALAFLLLAASVRAAAPLDAPTQKQEADFRAVAQRVLKEGVASPVTSIAATLGFDRGLQSRLLRFRQDDSPDDAEHVFAVFFSSAPGGWRLLGAQLSSERGHMGVDGKTIVVGQAFRLDMRGLVVRAFEIPEGPIDSLTARGLAVNGKTIRRAREELAFFAETAPRLKLKPADH